MDFGRDTIVVEWKAVTSQMHSAMAKMRQDAQHTRAVMNARPTNKDPENMRQRIGWARWYYNQMRSEGKAWAQQTVENVRRAEAAAKRDMANRIAWAERYYRASRQEGKAWAQAEVENVRRAQAAQRQRASGIRQGMAAQHAVLNLQRAEKQVIYELAKANRWLRGDALKSFRDQVAAAKQLHAQRVAEIAQLSDVKQRELALIDANNRLAQSLRQISSDARKASTDQRLAAGPGWGARFKEGFFAFVSWLRAVRYVAWVLRDILLGVGRAVSFVVNAFMSLMRIWKGVVSTALKFGAAVGTAVVGALALATKQAIEFETAMLRVGGVLTKNLEQMGALEQSIRSLAKSTTISPSELALGAFSLASFGYGQKQTASMLPGVATLSMASSGEYAAAHGGMGGVTGGYMNVRRAAEGVARVLLVYKMRASEAARVSNVLAAANAWSAATFERLYTALPRGLQAATLINTSFEELVATLSQLMNVGMEGGQAGPAFFGFVQRLIAPTKEMQGAFEPMLRKLGLTMKDINPAIVGLRGSLLNLERVYRNVTDATWANMVAVFRNRQGALALNALVKQGVAEHDRMTRAITGTNQAWQQASIMVSGVAGRWAFFLSSLKEFAITLTEKIRRPLAWFLDQLGRWFNWLSSTPQVKALANALGGLAWNLARLGIRLLGLIDIRKNWKDFVSALAGYMGRAAKIVVVGVGLVEYGLRSIADENSPLRRVWSMFWDFIVWSVEQAGGLIVGAVAGIRKILDNYFGQDANKVVSQWGNAFVALIAEVMRQSLVILLSGLSDMSGALADWYEGNEIVKFLFGYNPASAARLSAAALAAASNEVRTEDITGRLKESGKAIAAVFGRYANAPGSVLSGAKEAFQGGRATFSEMMHGGGGKSPVTDMIRTSLGSMISGFADTAMRLRQRGNAAANVFGPEGEGMLARLSDDLEGSLDDNTDEVDGNTQQLERFNDKIDGLISKVIGAPLEALQRYVSPVTLAGAGGAGGIGPLMGLPGGPARPSTIYQTFNFDFGNGVKESFRYELTQGGGARLMDHKITNAFKQAIPAMQGR